jgi:hypothetical protein
MHRSRRLGALALATMVIAFAAAGTPARATDIAAKSWEIGGDLVHTGYDNDSTFADTYSFSVRGGFALKPRHMLELNLNKQSTDSQDPDIDTKFDISRITINYLGNIKSKKPDSKLAGYALFGIGEMFYDDGDNSASSTYFRGGGGVRYFFTKAIALRIEGVIGQFHGDDVIIPRRGFFEFDLAVGVSFMVGGS